MEVDCRVSCCVQVEMGCAVDISRDPNGYCDGQLDIVIRQFWILGLCGHGRFGNTDCDSVLDVISGVV